MSTKTIGVSGSLRAIDYPRQDNTYDLSTGAQLDLWQIHSTDIIRFVGYGYAGPYTGTLNVTSVGGTTIVDGSAFGQWTGNIHIYNGDLRTFGGSHSYWTNVGDSVISGDSNVQINTMMGSGGTIELSHGARLEWTGGAHSSPVTIKNGGTLVSNPFFYPTGLEQNVTFGGNAHGRPDEVDLVNAFNAASWSMKDDLLQVFDAAGGVLTSITNFHNASGRAIQVDQTATGVAVTNDTTPRPGMLL